MSKIVLLLLFLMQGFYVHSQQMSVDSLEKNNTLIPDLVAYIKKFPYDTVDEFLSRNQAVLNKEIITNVYLNLGNLYEEALDFQKAIFYTEKAKQTCLSIPDVMAASGIDVNLGISLMRIGNNMEAVKRFSNAASYYKTSTTWRENYIIASVSLIEVYTYMQKFSDAAVIINALNQDSSIGKLITDLRHVTSLFYFYQQDYINSNKELYKVLSDTAYSNSNLNYPVIYSAMVTNFARNRQIDSAIRYYKILIRRPHNKDNLYFLSSDLQAQAEIALAQKKYNIAISLLLKQEDILRKLEFNNVLKRILKQVASIYALTGNQKSAFEYLNKYTILQDSIHSQSINYGLSTLKTEYENLTNKAKLNEAQKEKMILKQKSDSNKVIFKIILLLVLSIFIIIYLIIRRENIRVKFKAKELENYVNTQKVEQLELTLKTQNQERKRIAEELHDGLGGYLLSIKMLVEQMLMQGEKNSILYQMKAFIADTQQSMRNTIHDLLPHNIETNTLSFILKKVAEDFNKSYVIPIHFTSACNCSEYNIDINTKKEVLWICKEILTNAIKYAHATSIHFSISCAENGILIIIEDDGKGFVLQEVIHGMGLDNMKMRSKKIGAILHIDTMPDNGTVIQLSLPLQKAVKSSGL